jgi:hypothetical protein
VEKMKTFSQWSENCNYNPSIDGPPLDPHTIAGTEVQIRTLARNIRSSFVHRPNNRWKNYRDQIFKATELLDQAANSIGENMDGQNRNTPWNANLSK